MYERLKRYFAHAEADLSLAEERKLKLRVSPDHSLILDRNKLEANEIALLNTLFSEQLPDIPVSEDDYLLYTLLMENKKADLAAVENILTLPLRFIHVFLESGTNEKEELAEALKGLFPGSQNFLWRSEKEGVLIQQIDSDFEEELSTASVIDTLATDFYINVSFYIGSPVQDLAILKQRYDWEHNICREVKKSFPRKSYFYEQEIMIYYLLHNAPETILDNLTLMLEPVIDDRTLIDSVKTYLECNMNTTSAAKKLFMHRNTLQYRVDKFIEKTSVDIKQFPNAVAVYIILSAADLH